MLGASLSFSWQFRSSQSAIFEKTDPVTVSTTASDASPDGFTHTNSDQVIPNSNDTSMVSQ
ncbi:hypothetical protein DPMN_174427 [Dreissena polymorpha]|uniref:Uncharacterized protein n=1 Tax=Dreissena polymorpha TaxID=45954 RepID=A0A9D4IF48_DREPO|nr:hypothetical protein DPMN_174427 [Dreissena polymorpha]